MGHLGPALLKGVADSSVGLDRDAGAMIGGDNDDRVVVATGRLEFCNQLAELAIEVDCRIRVEPALDRLQFGGRVGAGLIAANHVGIVDDGKS